MYLRLDEGIIDGNLRYKDAKNIKKVLEIKSGTTVIMDGNVPHKPQDPYGTGIRDLIIISFKKIRFIFQHYDYILQCFADLF